MVVFFPDLQKKVHPRFVTIEDCFKLPPVERSNFRHGRVVPVNQIPFQNVFHPRTAGIGITDIGHQHEPTGCQQAGKKIIEATAYPLREIIEEA